MKPRKHNSRVARLLLRHDHVQKGACCKLLGLQQTINAALQASMLVETEDMRVVLISTLLIFDKPPVRSLSRSSESSIQI